MDFAAPDRSRRGIRLLGTWVTALALVAVLSGTAQADVITASSVLRAATKAIDQQTGAHVVFAAHSSAQSTTETITADVGLTSGSEMLSEGKANLAIRLTPTHAYVRGSSSGLTALFGLAAAQAKKLGAKWVSWGTGAKEYSNLKADVTMSSVLLLLPKANGSELVTKVIGGAKLYVLKWVSPATTSIPKLSNTLTIAAGGASLPIEESETSATGVTVTTQISRWNEQVTVVAPPAASTVASSKITG